MSANARKAAVMMLLYPDAEQVLHFCLIQRPTYDGKHCTDYFWGKKEEQDVDSATALRTMKKFVNSSKLES